MKIQQIQGIDKDTLASELLKAIHESRFTAEVENFGKRDLVVRTIRLRKTKAYCGNHPCACESPIDKPHHKLLYLEGADWVEFNDMVNDVLDRLHASAYVHTCVCIVRKGTLRRVRYSEAPRESSFGNYQWLKDEPYYLDYTGKEAQPSEFPSGTPGIHSKVGYFCVG